MTQFLKGAYDIHKTGKVRPQGAPASRPLDAATLLLVRRDQKKPRVLVGKRSSKHDFMPDKYVFPGGRVDPDDGRAIAHRELTRLNEARLRVGTRRRPRAFALTAIRETFEETGLIIGQSGDMPTSAPKGWQPLYELGVAPDLEQFTFIGRAITPPYRPKRFDARFFMAEAETVLIDERPPLDGAELHDLQWVTLGDAMALDLPNVTRFMLGELDQQLSSPQKLAPAFLRWTRKGHAADRILPR